MNRIAIRVAVTAAVLVAGTVSISSPASAANIDGRIEVRGPGSLYTSPDDGHYVTLATAPGTAATFSIRVVNLGAAVAQYRLHALQHGTPWPLTLTTGALVATPLAQGPDGYYTQPINPGGSQVIAMKITPPSTATVQDWSSFTLALYSTSGVLLNTATVGAHIKSPTAGGLPYELYVRSGSQPFVGGTVDERMATAPSVAVGGVGTFTLRLRNDGPGSSTIGLGVTTRLGCDSSWKWTAKVGATVVTSDVASGKYYTPVLAHGAYKDVTVAVRYAVAGSGSCATFVLEARSLAGPTGPLQHYEYLAVNAAA